MPTPDAERGEASKPPVRHTGRLADRNVGDMDGRVGTTRLIGKVRTRPSPVDRRHKANVAVELRTA